MWSLNKHRQSIRKWTDYYKQHRIEFQIYRRPIFTVVLDNFLLFAARRHLLVTGKFAHQFIRTSEDRCAKIRFVNKKTEKLSESAVDNEFIFYSLFYCLLQSIKSIALREKSVHYAIQFRAAGIEPKEFSGSVWNNGKVVSTAISVFDTQFQIAANLLLGNISPAIKNVNNSYCASPYKIKFLAMCLLVRLKSKVAFLPQFITSKASPTWNLRVIKKSTFAETPFWNGIGNQPIQSLSEDFEADPFLFKYNGQTWLLFEKLVEHKGEIWISKIHDAHILEKQPLIVEDFHLSYPFVFMNEGKVVICPESSACSEIRMYEFSEFPNKLARNVVLVQGIDAVDSNIYFQNGLWYLHTAINFGLVRNNYSSSWILMTEDLEAGEWKVLTNYLQTESKLTRNGGSFMQSGVIYRPSQAPSFSEYGTNLSINSLSFDSHNSIAELNLLNLLLSPTSPIKIHHLSACDEYVAFDFSMRN